MTSKCNVIKQELNDLKDQILDIQSDPDYIQDADSPNPGKPEPSLLAAVKALWQKVSAKSAQYDACRLAEGGLPDTMVVFKGRAVLTTSNSAAKGPFTHNISIQLLFHKWDHSFCDIVSFPPIIVGPFPVPGGTNTTTISLKGAASGSCNRTTGVMKLTLPLHFHESNMFAADSDITFVLSTETLHPKGSRIDSAGHVTVSATAIFQSGFLGGEVGTLTVTGTLTPRP